MKRVRERREAMEFAEWLAGQEISRLILRLAPALMTYLFGHTDFRPNLLDIDRLEAILSPQPELRKKTMTVLEKFRQEGRQEGMEKGLWIGKIQLLEEMLGLDAAPKSELESVSLPQIEARFRQLEAEYARRFRKDD